jgi:hypothetical protein
MQTARSRTAFPDPFSRISVSFAKVLPFAVAAAALLAACSDVSSPTQASSIPASPLARKGGVGGGGGAGGGGGTQLIVTTPPTANATGTWVGTSDGPDIRHTYTFTLDQTGAGMVSGAGTVLTPFTTVTELVVGTVNGDTLMLYAGSVCGSCTLNPLYRGIISSSRSRVNGSFLAGGISPVTLFKQ